MSDIRVKHWNQQVFCELVTMGRQIGPDRDELKRVASAYYFLLNKSGAMSDNMNPGTKLFINSLYAQTQDPQPK